MRKMGNRHLIYTSDELFPKMAFCYFRLFLITVFQRFIFPHHLGLIRHLKGLIDGRVLLRLVRKVCGWECDTVALLPACYGADSK